MLSVNLWVTKFCARHFLHVSHVSDSEKLLHALMKGQYGEVCLIMELISLIIYYLKLLLISSVGAWHINKLSELCVAYYSIFNALILSITRVNHNYFELSTFSNFSAVVDH